MHINRLEHNGFESLVATTRRTKTPKVLLAAHLDVVPGDDALFSLKEKGGKYYGRGTYDMKFAIPAFLQVVDDLQDKLQDYDFGIMITTDEEVSGENGTGWLVKQGYRPEVAVLPDGGTDWNLETFAKGVWHITLNASGKSAHGSRPWEGDSAINKLLDGLSELRSLLDAENREASTINVGTISGGEVVNQIADHASAAVDIRIGRSQNIEALKKKVLEICKRNSLSAKTVAAEPPIINNLDTPLLSSFAASVEKVIGRKTKESMSFGSSDAKYFTALGIPCAIVRPEGGNLHGPDEWISKQGFFDLRKIVKDYIEREARLSTEH